MNRGKVDRIFRLLKKGISQPGKIPNYIFNLLLELPAAVHDSISKRRYEPQVSQLDEFRSNEEWLLIVLDACRFDRFAEIAPEYIDSDVVPVAAAAEDTFGYLRECWPGVHDVNYVTGAAPVTNQEFDFDQNEKADGLVFEGDDLYEIYEGYVPKEHLENIIEVWKESWDETLGVCPPEPVTDKAIELAPRSNKMVVHYFQPHEPYIGDSRILGNVEAADEHLEGGAIGRGIWERVESGAITDTKLREAYGDNLRRVMGEVALLVHEVQEKFDNIAVMGDHGEALGEYDQYTHSIKHPYVRVVPWAEVDGVREASLPEPSNREGVGGEDNGELVEGRLRELGYLE